jgi:hypothetical protein
MYQGELMKNDLLRFIGFLFLLLACRSDFLHSAEYDGQSLFQLPFSASATQPTPAGDSTLTLDINGQAADASLNLNTENRKGVLGAKLMAIGLIGLFWFIGRKKVVNAGFESNLSRGIK